MYLIVGLGNPGKKFDGTRHNVGFQAIDYLAKKEGIKVNKLKFKSLIGEGRIGRNKVILMKPQTFMNVSGEAVIAAMNYYGIEVEKLIVIYDDIDTAAGKLRIRVKGSAGSHNGMRSIISLIEVSDFPRVRIGIGKPTRGELADFVLSRFTKAESKIIDPIIENAGDSIGVILKDGIDKAMNEYN